MFGFGKSEKQCERPAPLTISTPTAAGFVSPLGTTALVTGSSGMCGARLVELLLQRGTVHVVCFDVAVPAGALARRFERAERKSGGKITICAGPDGDLTSDEAVAKAFRAAEKIDICYHVGALVGPFHEYGMYKKVNLDGTIRIIENCRRFAVPKLVFSSSPSTRFTGDNVTGQREEELPFPKKWLAMYAETKAYAEMEVSKASCPELLTISVAPHQVYGPHDGLFLPNLLETAGNGRLRIFGEGRNKISVCYVDNYAHGLICGADALYPDSPALGKFYICTDGEPQYLWDMINVAVVAMGFADLHSKFHLPVWFLYSIAYLANVVGWAVGKKFKLNPFNIRMMTIHRYFSIENAQRDLKYEPLKKFDEAWPETIQWFKENWLPGFNAKSSESKSSKAD
jgi:sterol-4alpha-carboxylate 3-dehydrogenase (decarboxylating)